MTQSSDLKNILQMSYVTLRHGNFTNPDFSLGCNSIVNSSEFRTAPSPSGKSQQNTTKLATWHGLPTPTPSCMIILVGIPHSDSLQSHRKGGKFDEARQVFTDVHMKNLDWPEAVWEAWISFEHFHGTVEQVDACLDKLEKAQYQVNTRRAKVSRLHCEISMSSTGLNLLQEAEKASYQAMQVAIEAQAANIPVAQAPVPKSGSADVEMAVNTASRERGIKRGADDVQDGDGHKRARLGTFL